MPEDILAAPAFIGSSNKGIKGCMTILNIAICR